MKQNVAILALFVGAAVAQTRQDKDVKGPKFLADKLVDNCEISGDDGVKTALEAKKVSSDKVEKLKGELKTATELVASERVKRDEAVKAVVAKDELFKAALAEADKAENDAMAKYKLANDAQKVYDDAKALSDASKIVTDAMESEWNTLSTDKVAAEKAVADAVAHKQQEDTSETEKKDLYGGVIGTTDEQTADGGGDCTKGACKATKAAKEDYEAAQATLKQPKADYDAKVIAVAAAKVEWDTAFTIQSEGQKTLDAQDIVVGATDLVAGKKKDKKTADTALTDYNNPGDLKVKQDDFAAKGKAIGDAWKAVLVAAAAKTYTGAADKKCTGTATAENYTELSDITYDTSDKCKTKCEEKDYYSTTASKTTLADSADYCYGYELTADNKCRMFKKILAAKDDGAAGSGCWQRDASKLAMDVFITNTLDDKLETSVTAYTSTITTAWEAKIDAAEDARSSLDMETKIQTYLKDEYMEKAVTGLKTITTAKESTYNTLNGEKTNLKTAADNLGMDDSKTLAAFTPKTMANLKTTYDDAVTAQAAAKLVWEAAKTEKSRMAATDAINKQWETDAKAAFKKVDDLYSGDGKQKAAYAALLATTSAKKDLWDTAQKAYTDHIALAEYTEKAVKAKTAEDTSDIAEQKAVVTARGLATDANTKVKDAIKAEAAKRAELDAEKDVCAGLEVKVQEALEVCESKQYATFRTTFQGATTKRGEDLATIKALMDKREKDALAKKPGSGKAGARCERPRSNGDARGRKACEAELCCGAATKLIGQTEVTIETCQKLDATKYSYQPPRAAMGLAMPAVESWDFACIDGAKRVLAAAAAAAAAGLMMQ